MLRDKYMILSRDFDLPNDVLASVNTFGSTVANTISVLPSPYAQPFPEFTEIRINYDAVFADFLDVAVIIPNISGASSQGYDMIAAVLDVPMVSKTIEGYIYFSDASSMSSFFNISSSGAVDFTQVITAIESAKAEIMVTVPNIDLTPIESSLTTIKGYTDTLEIELSAIKSSLVDIVKDSLNGNGSEYSDGDQVNVNGRTLIYNVVRSYMGMVQDSSYTLFYDLVSSNGSKLTVPEALLTQYVAPIIVP